MKLLLLLLIWVGCLVPYLASRKQQLITASLPLVPSWIGFVICQTLAVWGLSGYYSMLTASLITLMLVMCIWVGLTLIATHLSGRFLLVCSIGMGFFSIIILAGST